MGLDVYLSHYSDYNRSKQLEQIYDDYSNEQWERITDTSTDEEKAAVRANCAAKAAELGLDEYGQDQTYQTRIQIDSVLHPDHMFKIGYFRSSYNEGGINRVLENLGIPGLYDIFPTNDHYEFSPDWDLALEVVQKSIKLLKKDKGYRITSVSPNLFSPDDVPATGQDAMNIFLDELKRRGKGFDSYSNKNGEFYLGAKGLTVHGMMPGKDMFQRPCTYVVYKPKGANKFYIQALEIVKETIEYVLSKEDPSNYYLRWSS